MERGGSVPQSGYRLLRRSRAFRGLRWTGKDRELFLPDPERRPDAQRRAHRRLAGLFRCARCLSRGRDDVFRKDRDGTPRRRGLGCDPARRLGSHTGSTQAHHREALPKLCRSFVGGQRWAGRRGGDSERSASSSSRRPRASRLLRRSDRTTARALDAWREHHGHPSNGKSASSPTSTPRRTFRSGYRSFTTKSRPPRSRSNPGRSTIRRRPSSSSVQMFPKKRSATRER